MGVPHAGNAHYEVCLFVAERNPAGVLQHHDARVQDALLGVGRPVRNGDAHAHIGRCEFLAAQHGIRISGFDISARCE